MRRTLPFCLIIAVLCSCASPKIESDLSRIRGIVKENPRAALRSLDSLNCDDINTPALKAEYGLLKTMAADKCFINTASDSLIAPSVHYFAAHGPKSSLMESLYYHGVVCFNANDRTRAIVLLDKALGIAHELEDHYYEGLINMTKQAAYSKGYMHKEALLCDSLAIVSYSLIGDTVSVRRSKAKHVEALVGLERFDQARKELEPLLDEFVRDTIAMRILLSCYGVVCLMTPELGAQKALEQYNRYLTEYHGRFTPTSASFYADALYQAGKKDQAKMILEALKSGAVPKYVVLHQQYLFSKREKKYDLAIDYLEDLVEEQNVIVRKEMEQSLYRAERELALKEKSEAFAQSQKRQTIIVMLISLVVILILITIWIVQTIRRRHKIRISYLIQDVDECKRLIEETTDDNKRLEKDLADVRKQYISAYKGQITQIAKLVETYRHAAGERSGRDMIYKHVSDIAVTVADDQPTYKALERRVNAHFDDIMKHYREEYPGRNESHYHLVCYLIAGFPASTIQLLLHISQGNVYTRKSRLIEEISKGDSPHKEQFIEVLG